MDLLNVTKKEIADKRISVSYVIQLDYFSCKILLVHRNIQLFKEFGHRVEMSAESQMLN